MDLDVSKLPGCIRGEFVDSTISLWYDTDPRHARGTGVSSVEWAKEMIRHRKEIIEKSLPIVEAGGWPSSSNAANDIRSAEQNLLYWENIALPCAIEFERRLTEDPEVEHYPWDERKKFCGKMFGTLLKGPNSSITQMGLKPGDRFVNNDRHTKFILQEWRRTKNEFGFNHEEYNVLSESTGKVIVITDSEHYQKLPGKGKVFPSRDIIERVGIACGLDYYEYAEYLTNTLDRYMRINNLLEITDKEVDKVADLIKSLS